MQPEATLARIDRRTLKGEGCWRWDGFHSDGYAAIQIGGRTADVHRVLWVLTNGEPPAGYDVHHECGHRGCVNPAHLALKSKADHARDHQTGRPKAERCRRGHSWAEHGQWTGGRRRCLACRREWEQSRVDVSAP